MKSIILTLVIGSSGTNFSGNLFDYQILSSSPISYYVDKKECLDEGKVLIEKMVASTLRNQKVNEFDVQLSYSYRCD